MEFRTAEKSLLLCCFNDVDALTQQAAKRLYAKGLSVIYCRDRGSDKDREHLSLLISDKPVTAWYSVAFDANDVVGKIFAHICAA